MKQTNERLCALAQKGDAAALDSLIENNKSFIGKVANDLFRSMNLAQSGLNLDTDDLKQAGNLGLWKAVPKFDAARGIKFLTYAAPAIRNAMMDMVRDAFTAFEQRMVTEDKDGICYQRVSLDVFFISSALFLGPIFSFSVTSGATTPVKSCSMRGTSGCKSYLD